MIVSGPMRLVELVPNVSEGRDRAALEELTTAFREVPGLYLLDLHSDPSHHRSVLTAVARPESAAPAVLALVERAVELIDLRKHRGAHPRIGAVDVVPLVPLETMQRDETIALARDVAREIAERLALPVFLYGDAAARPHYEELSFLRRGGFEALEERMARGELVPDFGPPTPHPSAGATAVGVRDLLLAYNVNLKGPNPAAARAIAGRVREAGGGLPAVKALGIALAHRGLSQVSMNLTDFRKTSLTAAFDRVREEAFALGVEVESSEIVGLVPEAAAFEGMEERLLLEEPPGILEERLRRYLMP